MKGYLILASFLSSVFALDGLDIRAKAAGKLYFGTATDNPGLSDAPYVARLKNVSDFGQITVGNTQKWDSTEPARGQFSYKGGDEIVSLAQGNGQMVRCHTLVWYNQLPSWVSDGGFDNSTLVSILQNHIKNVVTHYKGKCYAWDVVNEAINDDGGTFRKNVFFDTIGPAYIPIAFAAAAAADPGAKLYYNDYNIESPSPKTSTAIQIVKMIKAYGVKIDGVGLQAHLIGGQVPNAATLGANLKSFTDLGVEVAYTELDIRIPVPVKAAAQTQQVTDYANVVASCKNSKKCVGITIWDLSDDHSWIPGVFPGFGSALPFDSNKQPKPLYWSILNAWSGSSCGSACTPSTQEDNAAVVQRG